MNEKNNNLTSVKNIDNEDGEISLPEYLLYPASDDIYLKSKKESDIDPEDISRMKELNDNVATSLNNEKDFIEDVSGNDLDIPGSELDDVQENIGSEDEENNHYSLGGDNHNDLEEDRIE